MFKNLLFNAFLRFLTALGCVFLLTTLVTRYASFTYLTFNDAAINLILVIISVVASDKLFDFLRTDSKGSQ